MLVTFNQVKHHPRPQTLLTIYDKVAVPKHLLYLCDVTYKGGLILMANCNSSSFMCTNQDVTMGHHLKAL